MQEIRSDNTPKPMQDTLEPTLGENSTSTGAVIVKADPVGKGLSSVTLNRYVVFAPFTFELGTMLICLNGLP